MSSKSVVGKREREREREREGERERESEREGGKGGGKREVQKNFMDRLFSTS